MASLVIWAARDYRVGLSPDTPKLFWREILVGEREHLGVRPA